ncbi:MAG: glycosyltransferase [Deltaproteobacteria bacterium]|nr:glycosyltransferase [Deltaproteobacteria bacterium]
MPWKIVHLDVSQGIPPLSSGPGFQGFFVVLWWHTIPLGQCWIPKRHLPMGAAELTEHALTVITPAVERHLQVRSVEAPSVSNRHPERGDRNLEILPLLDRPLKTLQDRLSLHLRDTGGLSASLIICTKDRPDQLKRYLLSLQSLSYRPREIWVVDNAPRSDATRQTVARFPDIRYIQEPRAGLDVARNTGIRHASGEIVVFTDDDVTVHPDWIARIMQGFNHPKVMAVTGLVLPAELNTEAQYLFERYWGFGRGYLSRSFGRPFFERKQCKGVPVWQIGAGANMAFRREVFDRVGPFDERLDVGAAGCSGDSEMWYRILARGWICHYEPTAVVYHYHRRKLERMNKQIYDYMRGHVAALLIQFEKHRHRGNLRRLFLSLPNYYARLAVKGVLNGFSGRERTLHKEIRGCLSGLAYYATQRRPVNSFSLSSVDIGPQQPDGTQRGMRSL